MTGPLKKPRKPRGPKKTYEEKLAANREWRANNLELAKAQRKAYYHANKERIKKKLNEKIADDPAAYKAWKSAIDKASRERRADSLRAKHQTEEFKVKRRKMVNDRHANDEKFRYENLARGRFTSGLRIFREGGSSPATENIIGCSLEFFHDYIAKKFKEGMTWSNRGEWHLDHIVPLKDFDLSSENEVRKCFHYSNCQPLWAIENIKKSAKK